MKQNTLLYTVKQHMFNGLFTIGHSFGVNKGTVSVLCYHSIGTRENRYSVSLSTFKSHITLLQKTYTFISIDEAVSGEYKGVKPALTLTVDDGYQDIIDVLPFLKKRGIPLTLFVLSESKHVNREELDHTGKLLTPVMLKKLSRNGVTIGSHSITHADLAKSTQPTLRYEIVESKKRLEKIIGKEVSYFAYPKGKFTKHVISQVRKAGYSAAFTVYPGLIKRSSDKLVLPRIVISNSHKTADLPELVSRTSLIVRNVVSTFSFKEGSLE